MISVYILIGFEIIVRKYAYLLAFVGYFKNIKT